jgi:hypothetical protein
MKLLRLALSAPIFLFCTGCASIVSKSVWPFSVDTNPDGAKVIVRNKRGNEVYVGRTPAVMRLHSGAGFFSKESYTVELSMAGYETKKINVECRINGWYFGNVVFGGLLGFLIVDPATGAMYRLDREGISEDMQKLPEHASSTSLQILSKDQVPKAWLPHLVKLSM